MTVSLFGSIFVADTAMRYVDLADYCRRNGLLKSYVADQLGVQPWFFTELLNPDRYRPKVDDTLAVKIAGLLNQPIEYVNKLYGRTAA